MPLYTTLLYSISGFLVMAIGGLIYLKDRESRANQSLFLYAINIVLLMLSVYAGYLFVDPVSPELSTFFIRLTFTFAIFITFSLCAFAYYYPRKIRAYSFKVETTFFIVTLLTAFFSCFTPLVYESEIIIDRQLVADVHGPLHSFYLIHFLFNSFLAIWLALNKINFLRGIEKKKTLVSFVGLSIAILSMNLFYTILPKFDIYLLQAEAVLFNLIFIGATFYSITKYRFFNLSAFASNLLRKIVFFTLIILIALSLGYMLKKCLPQMEILINVLVLILGIYIYQLLNGVFPKFIPHNLREFKRIVAEMCSKMLFCDSYKDLRNRMELNFIIKLNISKVKVFLIRSQKKQIDIPIYIKDSFTEYLEKNNTQIILKEEIPFLGLSAEDRIKILTVLEKLDVSVCVPLFSEKKIIGLFVLGTKENKEPYLQEEIELILNLKKNLEICFMNILLKKNLKEENNLMKLMIKEKTKQVRDQYTKIKELLKQQSSFIAVTAHEFRTPLSIALFQLEDFLENKQNKDFNLEEIKNIEDSLNNLKELTENLFDVQQYDLNKISLNLEKIDVYKFIKSVFDSCQNLVLKKQIKLSLKNKLKKTTYFRVDKQKMLQVFHNLITNAIKFTPKKGEITLEISQEGKTLLIKVSDTGKGILDKDKKRIFEKFQTEKIGSTTGIGLGLYICKKIINLHKGKIWLENNEKNGSVFKITLKSL